MLAALLEFVFQDQFGFVFELAKFWVALLVFVLLELQSFDLFVEVLDFLHLVLAEILCVHA